MCGIAGFFNLSNTNRPEGPICGAMLNAIRHRGPDGENQMVFDNAVLGFNRLALIDLKHGMQPLQNEDKTVTMLCNGEIFNSPELRKDLEAKGHVFRTNTDVEVIVHLYEEHGADFAAMLNGEFAIVLFDSKNQRFLMVRDQMGICPLYYTAADGRLIFASEIKAILEYPGIERKLNLKALDMLMNYPGVISPETFFKGVKALQAGHMLVGSLADKSFKDVEYWDLEYCVDAEDKGEKYYAETLRELLHKAIERRLMADAPVGFYVSGGLDSSVCACFVKYFGLDAQYSFSAEIADGELNESRYQKIVLDYVKSNHSVTRITEKEIWDNLPDVIYHAESGVKESYDVAAYMLSALAHKSPVKAVLTGQGSDELFCGYVGHMVDLFRNMQKDSMTKEELEINERLWGDPYFRYERNHPEIRKIHEKVYSKEVASQLSSFSAIAESPINPEKLKGYTTPQRRCYIDAKLRLQDHLLLEHGDRMAFANSIEGRHPFLDADIVKFVTTLPDKYKLRGANEKYIIKKAAEGIVPQEILKRRKFPFQAPGMSSMIKKSSGTDYLSDELINKYGIFDAAYLNQLKAMYSQEDFKLMGAYDIDYLLIATTVTILCEKYGLSL